MKEEYVVIAPNHMIYVMNFRRLLKEHEKSGADITLLYHSVSDANVNYLNCSYLTLNRQSGVLSVATNRGTDANRDIFMDTYVMKKDLFIELIKKARALSSMYTLAQIVNIECEELDIRGYKHEGYFAAITNFKSYYDANLSLIKYEDTKDLFDEEWPIYTRTNDSCPTQYYETANVKQSVVSNGCIIEGTIENSIIGRGCTIKKGVVIKNSLVLPDTYIEEGIHVENHVVGKHSKLIHCKELVADAETPGYVRRGDTL
jgi:glucose-1-phosphate adenylyltransferase